MKVEALTQVSREHARELYQKYLTHREHQTPQDEAIAAIYKRIARGQVVIQALESIRRAGLNSDGAPHLAICRADMQTCWWRPNSASCTFGERYSRERSRKTVTVRWEGLQAERERIDKDHRRWEFEAVVPLIPVHLRPKRGMANYHVLWEAEWTRRYPVDPYLLRRIGKGDAWLVVAAWDLTDVERAVMSGMLNG